MEKIQLNDLKTGDILFRPVIAFELLIQYGNYVGQDQTGRHWVVEHIKDGSCRLSLYEEFSKGYPVKVERIDDSERPAIIVKMRELLSNPSDYDSLLSNQVMQIEKTNSVNSLFKSDTLICDAILVTKEKKSR